MTCFEEYTVYCFLCGVPIWKEDEDFAWLNKTILLHSPMIDDPDIVVLEIPAIRSEDKGGTQFTISSTGEEIAACDVPRLGRRNPPLYFPCHAACTRLAKMAAVAINTRDTVDLSTSEDIHHLWKALVMFWKARIHLHFETQPIANLWNSGEYGGLRHYQELEWRFGGTEVEVFLADPLDTPSLTNDILHSLKLIPSSVDTTAQQTMNDLTHAALTASPKPTYTHHPSVYLQSLQTVSPILAWLFDLDSSTLLEKEAAKPQDREWDWERLVRRLVQDDLFTSSVPLDGIPPGLQNRRRIWKLLENWWDVEFGMEETELEGYMNG